MSLTYDKDGKVIGYTCKHIGLAFVTDLFCRKRDNKFVVRRGFAVFGYLNDEHSMDSNPFCEDFRDNYIEGVGDTLDEAIANLEVRTVEITKTLWV